MTVAPTDARKWARDAEAGDYLIKYADSGLTHAQDPGSRCGFDDADLAEIGTVLRRRDLILVADDRGLVVETASLCPITNEAYQCPS